MQNLVMIFFVVLFLGTSCSDRTSSKREIEPGTTHMSDEHMMGDDQMVGGGPKIQGAVFDCSQMQAMLLLPAQRAALLECLVNMMEADTTLVLQMQQAMMNHPQIKTMMQRQVDRQ